MDQRLVPTGDLASTLFLSTADFKSAFTGVAWTVALILIGLATRATRRGGNFSQHEIARRACDRSSKGQILKSGRLDQG
jgi:hypothetical protein